jgi:hypothetical protein
MMAGRGRDEALRRSVQKSGYVVDPRAVAEAILRSGVLVAAQSRDRAVRAEKDKTATG